MIIPVILATLFTSRYLELIIGLVPGIIGFEPI